MSERLRWGVIGTGGIAAEFAADLALLPTAEARRGRLAQPGFAPTRSATASASRTATPSYEELVADPEVDAVYVATPHPMHRADALLAHRGRQAVLSRSRSP